VRYKTVRIVASNKVYVKLLTDLLSENNLKVAKGTICELFYRGKSNTVFLSPDGEKLVVNNRVLDDVIYAL